MRVFEYEPGASPRDWGRAHGEAFRGMIAEIAAIRSDLTVRLGGFESTEAVNELAERHLPVLERFDAALYDELLGIAEGAALPASAVVILNHYTDLRDLGPASRRDRSEEGCSVVYSRNDSAALLAQTWDMHGSAEPYVLTLGVPASVLGPACWCFTIVGCVGMTGLSEAGVGITINNLKSHDATVGVVWPALVRKVLRHRRFADAARELRTAPVGSGHHYLVAAAEGALGLETSGTVRAQVFSDDGDGDSVFVHTNHCLSEETGAMSSVAATSTTYDRYRVLQPLEEDAALGRESLWRKLGSHEEYPRAVCTHVASPEAPHKVKTCGGLLMDLGARELWVAAGCLAYARPTVLGFPL